jgi:1-deoxy-D-xylulose-5-phosphate reductoisomerase
MQTITILGATGSIGLSTLDVIKRHPDKFDLYAITGNTNVLGMIELCQQYKPSIAVMADENSAQQLHEQLKTLGSNVDVLSGTDGLLQVCSEPKVTTVMAAIVGGAGLQPTLTAAKHSKRILLANKEALVMSGDLFLSAVAESNAILLPVDSEHNAIFQAMPSSVQSGGALVDAGVEKILLTGSGGPFLTKQLNEFSQITPEMAVAHPNWSMGAKISVDSATMMNKGLEFIEAKLLFNASFEQIDVVIHPQSIIHSMVSYSDGSVLAQMGQPDMRIPIAHTLSFPERIESGVKPLDFTQLADFSFCAPDFSRFPNLGLALEASKVGQGATTVLNASNEIAVAHFLNREISFNNIATLNELCLEQLGSSSPITLDDILELDQQTREVALGLISQL